MKHMQDAEAAAQAQIETAKTLLSTTLGPQVHCLVSADSCRGGNSGCCQESGAVLM